MSGRLAHRQRVADFSADVIAGLLASTAAYFARFHLLPHWLPVEGRTEVLPAKYLEALPVVAACSLAATRLASLGRYSHQNRDVPWADAPRASMAFGVIAAAIALVYWDTFQYSRATIALAALVFGPGVVLLRHLAQTVAERSQARRPVTAILGSGAPLRRLEAALRESQNAPPLVRFVTECVSPGAWPEAARVPEEDILALARSGEIAVVYIALPGESSGRLRDLVVSLEQTTADVHVVPDFGTAVLVNPGLTTLGDLPVLTLRESPLFGAWAVAKRGLDVGLSVLLGVAGAPILLLCALAVKATSRGPVLYRQERLGLDGRAFFMWKFRTMLEDAEGATGPVFTRPGDPRVTPVGRVLRRFSLDELPQLWNVLTGDMSLVGPRPERRPFIEDLRNRLPGYMLRHKMRAGMTGWAQVHGLRGESSREDRLRYDLEYIRRWSLTLDLEILGRTLLQVIGGRNAY